MSPEDVVICENLTRNMQVFFEDILRSNDDNSAKWKKIEHYLERKSYNLLIRYSNILFSSTVYPEKIRTVLLDMLESIRCENRILVRVVIDLIIYFSFEEEDTRDVFDETIDETAVRLMENLHDKKGESVFAEKEVLHLLIALRGDLKLMKVLLTYGFVTRLSGESSFIRHRINQMVFRSVMMFGDTEDAETDIDIHDLLNSAMSAVEMCEDNFVCCQTPESYRRIFFAAMIIWASFYKNGRLPHRTYVIMESRGHLRDYLNCLRIYFTATSDTFVTLGEVRRLLRACFMFLNREDLVDSYFGLCKEFMSESTEDYQPRKLLDISRTQVRECLGNYSPLPLAIGNVMLPTRLKDFICCSSIEETNISKEDEIFK